MVSTPMGTMLDIPENACHTCTYHMKTDEDGWTARVGDVLFTTFIELMVIFCWHGIWSFEDLIIPFELVPKWWSFVRTSIMI